MSIVKLRTVRKVDFAATYLPPSIPALLPDIADGELNLLPFKATFTPLRVEFPMWRHSDPSPEEPETLELFINERPVAKRQWTAPVKDVELFIDVEARFLIEGHHDIHYQVTVHYGETVPSEKLRIIIDKTPPYLGENDDLVYPPEVIRNGVTERYLEANGDQLLGQVPKYTGAAVGDKVRWYWSASPVGKELVGIRELIKADLDTPLTLAIPGDFIRQSKDGPRFARYEVQDRAGTAIQRSLAVGIGAAVLPAPRNLPPIKVVQAIGTAFFSTLKPRDALNGATLEIPSDAVLEDDDLITVFWGEPGTVGAYSSDVPITPGGRRFQVPKANIAPHMGKAIEVRYQVKTRADELFDSQIHRLQVEWLTGLPVVQCDKITDHLLVLSTMGDRASFSLPTWQHMATSQFVTVWLEGVKRGAPREKVTLPLVSEAPVPGENSAMPVGSLAKGQLQQLESGYQFQVKVRVSFDDKQSWLTFPHTSATLVDIPG